MVAYKYPSRPVAVPLVSRAPLSRAQSREIQKAMNILAQSGWGNSFEFTLAVSQVFFHLWGKETRVRVCHVRVGVIKEGCWGLTDRGLVEYGHYSQLASAIAGTIHKEAWLSQSQDSVLCSPLHFASLFQLPAVDA
jgi:hypothetical protein